MKKGILFDLDGTLWDSSELVITAWNRCIAEKTDRAERFTVRDMRGFMGKTLENIAALMFPSLPEHERLRIIEMCEDEEQAYLTEHCAPLYPHEKEVIGRLAEKYTLAVVSNSQDGYVQIYLEQCGFGELFSDMECAGRTGKDKDENIRLVMERNNITDCIYVGDTQTDMLAAEKAGVPFVHAAYGFGTPERCAASINDLTELIGTADRLLDKGAE